MSVRIDPRGQFGFTHPVCVGVAGVGEIFCNTGAVFNALFTGVPVVDGGQYLEVLRIFVGVRRVFDPNHLLVQLFTWPNTHGFLRGFGGNNICNLGDVHRWNFLYVNLTAFHILERMPNQFDTLF